MSNVNTRQLGVIQRIYKNSAGDILAIDNISVNINKEQVNKLKFVIYVDSIQKKRTLYHLKSTGSRVVSTVQSIGNYSSVQSNSGNYYIATWNAESADENRIEVNLQPHVASLGNTL